MKTTLLTLAGIITMSLTYAQIQLDQPGIPFPTTHTVVNEHIYAHPATLTAPTIGANQTWVYDTLTGGVTVSASFIPVPNTISGFPKAAMVDTGALQQLTPKVSVATNSVYGEDINGIYWYGNYTNNQVYKISKTDSVFIPDQTNALSTPQSLIALPATYKNFWDNNYTDSLAFYITVKLLGLSNAPGYGKVFASTRDSIAGWGTWRIPSPNKASIAYPVLLVKRVTTTIDSIFINKQSPSQLLLSAFGATQGQVTTDYTEYFYTANRFNAIMTIDFGSDSKYATPTSVRYNTDSIQSGINIYEPTVSNFNLYPNPVSYAAVICQFNKAVVAPWTLTVMNAIGQVVQTQNISGTGNINVQIEPGTFKSDGIYFVNIVDENGNLAANGKVSVAR